MRPNNGWVDVYKTMFDRMYKKTLERVATGTVDNLDGEAMLDDFEYTLIRPYVKENESGIKHKPYVGMDRIARLEYLDQLTKQAPSNLVDLYAEKYKNGELSLKQMRRKAMSVLGNNAADRERYVEIAGCVQALENVNKSRSRMWKILCPFKSNAEKRDAMLMKKMLIDGVFGREDAYNEIVAAAHETFDGHKRANANLEWNIARAREEMSQMQRMNDAMREPLCIRELQNESDGERSIRIDLNETPEIEKQI